jgi:hypothetical protein
MARAESGSFKEETKTVFRVRIRIRSAGTTFSGSAEVIYFKNVFVLELKER